MVRVIHLIVLFAFELHEDVHAEIYRALHLVFTIKNSGLKLCIPLHVISNSKLVININFLLIVTYS